MNKGFFRLTLFTPYHATGLLLSYLEIFLHYFHTNKFTALY